jgi:hypothetical protein
MEKKVDTINVQIKDYYGDMCLNDSMSRLNKPRKRKPEGEVHIFEVNENEEKKLIQKSNLVVYLGREVLAQSFLRSENEDGGTDYSNEFLCWFGLGSGGVLSADPLNPIPPNNQNTDLEASIMINATDVSCADYQVVIEQVGVEGYYKHPFETVEYETDPDNDDSYIVSKITISIGLDDANGYQISEAGLFTAESSSGGQGNIGPFHLFSRVTFPTLVKTADRRLVFVWYLYF